jgi:hypothetical protein
MHNRLIRGKLRSLLSPRALLLRRLFLLLGFYGDSGKPLKYNIGTLSLALYGFRSARGHEHDLIEPDIEIGITAFRDRRNLGCHFATGGAGHAERLSSCGLAAPIVC